tara:strand:+ start:33056 stop:37795 length:4740 start_codon:yes stop_codon:yes gene_type:complete
MRKDLCTGQNAALEPYHILDTLPEKEYDAITRLASFICETPIALVSLVTDSRQFFKSRHGIELEETPLTDSFCVHAIAHKDRTLLIKDARKDERFRNNKYVISAPNIVFYAGIVLSSKDGHPLGTLCVLDHRPRVLSPQQLDALQSLADQVVQLFELRRKSGELEQSKKDLFLESDRLNNILESTQAGTWEWDVPTGELVINGQWLKMLGYTFNDLGPITTDTVRRLLHPDDLIKWKDLISNCFEGKREYFDMDCRMLHKQGHWAWGHTKGKIVHRDGQGRPLLVSGTNMDITEQKTKDLQLQAITNNIPGVLVRLGFSKLGSEETLYISQGAKKMFGYTADRIMADHLLALGRYDRAERKEFRNYLRKWVLGKGIKRVYEWSYLHPDGSMKWHKISGNPTDLGNGSYVWDGMILDITDRKEAENKAVKSADHLLEAQRLAKMGSWNFDLNEDKISWTESLYDVYGVRKETFEVTYDSIVGLIDPEYRELAQKTCEHTRRTGEGFSMQYRISTPDGTKKFIEEYGFGEKNAEGGIVRLFGTAQDITDAKLAEDRISQINERYNYVNKATNDAIYDWDVTADRFQWGEGFTRNFGYEMAPQKEFTLADWAGLMYPFDRDKNRENWDSFMADPEQIRWNKEFRFRKEDGTYLWVEEIGHLIRDKKGRPLRMIGCLRDISEVTKTRLQDQLQQQLARFFKQEEHLPHIMPGVLKYLIDLIGFKTAEIWLKTDNCEEIGLFHTSSIDGRPKLFHKEGLDKNSKDSYKGMPSEVWKRQQVLIWDNIDTDQRFLRHKAAAVAGLRSAIGIPLVHHQEIVGVLLFCDDAPLGQDPERVKPIEGLQYFLGGEIKRKQQEEEMYLLFHSAPEIIAITSSLGHFIKVNPAFCKVLGYRAEELTNKPFTDYVHPEDRTKTYLEFKEAISGHGKSNNFVNRYKCKSGEYRYISWNTSDNFGADGKIFAFGRDVTDVKELEELLENASRLAAMGSWELNLLEGTLYFSKITREIHELGEKEILEVKDLPKFYPEWMIGFIAEMGLANNVDTSPWDHELPIMTALNNKRWVRIMGQAEIKDGKCTRLYGSLQDIHPQKMAELELQHTLQEKNNILESIGDAFFAVDRDWVVTYWNKEAEKILGKKRQEILGRVLWESYPDAVELKFHTAYKKAMESGETVHFDEFYPTTKQWFEVSAYPSSNGLSVYFKDVSIRKVAEEQVRISNERFETIAQATNDAVWDYNVEADTLFWGRGFTTLFGIDGTKENPTFEKWMGQMHPQDRSTIAENLQQALADPQRGNWFGEYRFLRKDGSYAFVMDRAVFIRDIHGKTVRAVGAMTDISYRKEYEDSLRKLNEQLELRAKELADSNAELEQFAYVASHDLQEPLRMVTSFMGQLEKKYSDVLDEKAHTYIYYAVDGAKRMRQIILDLLQFSRVGKYDDSLKNIPLNELVEEVRQLLHKKIQEKKATIIVENLPTFHTYHTPLVQILQNLIANAIEYSKKEVPPIVRISAEERENEWLIAVSDNGLGIDSEYFDRIFVIFQRLHSQGDFTGTGMGLSIVKKNVGILGGKIWVESEVGHGSTFKFTLLKKLL